MAAACGEAGAMCGDPGAACGDPGAACGDPGATCGEPGAACGEPGAPCGLLMAGIDFRLLKFDRREAPERGCEEALYPIKCGGSGASDVDRGPLAPPGTPGNC